MGLWMGDGNQKYQVMLTVQFSVTPPSLPSGAGLIVGIVEIMPTQLHFIKTPDLRRKPSHGKW